MRTSYNFVSKHLLGLLKDTSQRHLKDTTKRHISTLLTMRISTGIISALAAASASPALALVVAEFGNSAGLGVTPDQPGGGIGCGLLHRFRYEGEVRSWDTDEVDGCPAADLALFCDRWGGCPRNFNWASTGTAAWAINVESDNHDDRSITATISALDGRSQTVVCPWAPYEEGSFETVRFDWIWACNFDQV
jgi:hypothetical protein